MAGAYQKAKGGPIMRDVSPHWRIALSPPGWSFHMLIQFGSNQVHRAADVLHQHRAYLMRYFRPYTIVDL